MNDNSFYSYAYSLKGTAYYESCPGHYKKRISMIAALCNKSIIAPFMFEGHCNKSIFEAYIEKILLPSLKPGMTVIMDNASFHKSQKITNLIEKASCKLVFLPSYSPDLNPIEHYWHKIKNHIRKIRRDTNYSLSLVMEAVLKVMST